MQLESHLLTLYAYYDVLSDPSIMARISENVFYHMEYVTGRLLFHAGMYLTALHDKGSDYDRGLAQSKAQYIKTKKPRQKEVERLYKEIDPAGRKPYSIAKLIHKRLSKELSADIKTIRKDLKELHLC